MQLVNKKVGVKRSMGSQLLFPVYNMLLENICISWSPSCLHAVMRRETLLLKHFISYIIFISYKFKMFKINVQFPKPYVIILSLEKIFQYYSKSHSKHHIKS